MNSIGISPELGIRTNVRYRVRRVTSKGLSEPLMRAFIKAENGWYHGLQCSSQHMYFVAEMSFFCAINISLYMYIFFEYMCDWDY